MQAMLCKACSMLLQLQHVRFAFRIVFWLTLQRLLRMWDLRYSSMSSCRMR